MNKYKCTLGGRVRTIAAKTEQNAVTRFRKSQRMSGAIYCVLIKQKQND